MTLAHYSVLCQVRTRDPVQWSTTRSHLGLDISLKTTDAVAMNILLHSPTPFIPSIKTYTHIRHIQLGRPHRSLRLFTFILSKQHCGCLSSTHSFKSFCFPFSSLKIPHYTTPLRTSITNTLIRIPISNSPFSYPHRSSIYKATIHTHKHTHIVS